MAGETSKTTHLTNAEAGLKINARHVHGQPKIARERHAVTTAQLESADVLDMLIDIPSNAVVDEIAVYNDALDTGSALLVDFGIAAADAYTDVTSGTKTAHAAGDVIDADLFVDASSTLQAATTSYTVQAFDSVTFGPDKQPTMMWEVLGYDEDPHTKFRLIMTVATVPTGAQAGDLAVKVTYVID